MVGIMWNPSGIIPYAIFIAAAVLVNPWFLAAAAVWWLVTEVIF